MGIYAEKIVPRLLDKACGVKDNEELRRRVCADLKGDVIEVGFGSGHNVRWYPSSVTHVAAVEPSEVAWRLASKRVQASTIPVQWSGLDGQRLPFPDESFDAALSTWTMCTIPDVHAALLEIRRVLKPGASLHFVEHGLAPDESVRRWQRRFDPLQQRLCAGCHFTRPIPDLVTEAGFKITELETFYQPKAPKFAVAISLGAAASPDLRRS